MSKILARIQRAKRGTQKGVRVQERLEFNEGDVGLAGGIQADD